MSRFYRARCCTCMIGCCLLSCCLTDVHPPSGVAFYTLLASPGGEHTCYLPYNTRTHTPRARACCPSACGLRSEILKPPPPPAWRINRTRCRNAVKVRSLEANDCSIAELGVKSSCWDTQGVNSIEFQQTVQQGFQQSI